LTGAAASGLLEDVASGLSRVTIVSPRSRVDLALPADVPLADLLPVLLTHTGAGGDEAGRRRGWALSRVGGAELDTSRTAQAHAVRDGELLLLRPRGDEQPMTVFDDVVDALASGARDRRGRWTPGATRVGGLVAAVLTLTGAAIGLLFSGPPYGLAGLAGLGLGAVLLVVAVVYARALGSAAAGAAFGLLGTVYCGLGGLLIAAGDRSLHGLGVAHATVAVAAAAVAAAVAATGVPQAAPVFLTFALCAVAVPLSLFAGSYLDTGVAGGAAVTVVLAYACLPATPMLAYRLAGLPRPNVPTEREHMLEETETVDGARVLELGRRADAYLAALLTALAIASAGAAVLVAPVGWRGIAMGGVLGLLPILRSRWFTGRPQRLPLLVAGGVALAASVIAVAARLDPTDRLLLVGGLALGVVLLSIGLGLAVDRPPTPRWGRFLDIAEVLLIIAVAPLAVWVTGVLDLVRAIRG
jgi:type VII secretion integral membrane protein EccD